MADSDTAEAPEQPQAVDEAAGDSTPRIRDLDFSQPTKFTTELRRRIGRALDPFCDALGTWLSGELRADVQLSLTDIGQHTWAAAKARLPADSIAVAVVAESIERRMLLSVELPLVLQALECLMGGEAKQAPTERHLTEIDWVLTRGLLDSIVHELSTAWSEIDGPELTRGDVDIEGDAGVFTPIGEPTLSVGVQCAIDGLSAGMALLIPWAAIEPVAESMRGSGGPPQGVDAQSADALRRGLAGAQVLMRAEVGSVQMPIERMLELVPGALVTLQERSQEGVRLYAEEVAIGRGRPGASGSHRAIKLESTSEPPHQAETYAKLGRGELERARAHVQNTQTNAEGREILRSIFVRVWAELGRTHLPLGAALELAPGTVVELDQVVQAPVELFANGLCFANGSLVVTPEGDWGIQVSALV
jgi:flagellar motor switch protein FliM